MKNIQTQVGIQVFGIDFLPPEIIQVYSNTVRETLGRCLDSIARQMGKHSLGEHISLTED